MLIAGGMYRDDPPSDDLGPYPRDKSVARRFDEVEGVLEVVVGAVVRVGHRPVAVGRGIEGAQEADLGGGVGVRCQPVQFAGIVLVEGDDEVHPVEVAAVELPGAVHAAAMISSAIAPASASAKMGRSRNDHR